MKLDKKKYDTFVNETLLGNESIWKTMKKEKLDTFTTNNKSVSVTIDKEVIQIKEERTFLNRLLVVSRTRTDIDLPSMLGKYEFLVTPPSLFASDGTLHLEKKKSVLADKLRLLQHDTCNECFNVRNESKKVIIIDGMAIVNKIDIKKSNIDNCLTFAINFVNIIQRLSSEFQEARVIFDRYDANSLKNLTRKSRTKNLNIIDYKVMDSTRISHLQTKDFLASLKTKNELTEYLSKKLCENLTIDYVVVYGASLFTNISDLNENLKYYSQEEADTGIILHALDASKRDPLSKIVISCSDTDVLLMLLHYFDDLSPYTIFKTSDHVYYLNYINSQMKKSMRRALLGFHAFTGCDQTGKFSGFTKSSCWNALVKSSDDVLDAFAKLGEASASLEEVLDSLEEFVIQLYCRNDTPSDVHSLSSLRWFMFSKKQMDSLSLPPTKETLRQKVLRAHYTTLVWKSSHLPSPTLPDPVLYGWKLKSTGDMYEAVTTTLLPAPESIIHLSVCGCTTKCITLRCKCRKNNLKCSDMCKCNECLNTEQEDLMSLTESFLVDDDSFL